MASPSMRKGRTGFTLLEVAIAAIVMVFMFSQAAPKFWKAAEQMRVDLAGTRLVQIATAERLYYADNQTFTSSMTDLTNANLLDSKMPPGNGDDGEFTYTVSSSSATRFTATATRKTDPYWSGSITLDEKGGTFGGYVANSDLSIKLTPPSTSNGL